MGLIYMEQGKLDQAILEFNFVLATVPQMTGYATTLGPPMSRRNPWIRPSPNLRRFPSIRPLMRCAKKPGPDSYKQKKGKRLFGS